MITICNIYLKKFNAIERDKVQHVLIKTQEIMMVSQNSMFYSSNGEEEFGRIWQNLSPKNPFYLLR